jgi:hypothetical protein
VLLGRESLPVEEVGDARLGLGRVEVAAPANARLVGSRLSVAVVSDDVGEHRREQPVVVAAAGNSVARQMVDDARPSSTAPTLGNRLHEPGVGEQAEMPADRVRVQGERAGQLIGVEPVVRIPQSVDDHLPLPLAVHRATLSTRTLVESTDSRAARSS